MTTALYKVINVCNVTDLCPIVQTWVGKIDGSTERIHVDTRVFMDEDRQLMLQVEFLPQRDYGAMFISVLDNAHDPSQYVAHLPAPRLRMYKFTDLV